MNTTENKFNRSHSESDLSNVYSNQNLSFDNSTVQSFVAVHGKYLPVIRRAVYVEEIYPDYYSTLGRHASKQIIGGSMSGVNNLEDSFKKWGTIPNASTYYASPKLNVTSQFKVSASKEKSTNSDNNTPMEVDNNFSNEKTDEDLWDGFQERRDINLDAGSYCNDLKRIIKKRNTINNRTKITESDESFFETQHVRNKTVVVPITKPQTMLPSTMIYLVFGIAIASIFIYVKVDFMFFNREVQINDLHNDLLQKVHEQKSAIDVIVRNLKQRDRWSSKVKTLAFIGSSGVGKTFVANIVKRHFPPPLVHEVYMPHRYDIRWSEQVINSLKSGYFNLVVIDDLKKADTTDIFAFVHDLPKDQFTLVISIFNIQYADENLDHVINYDDITGIRDEFDQSGLEHELILFREFDIDSVRDWMDKQTGSMAVDYADKDKVKTNVLRDYNPKYNGLKGLYSKILLELNSNES